jgi:hypothetical protein
VNYTIGLMDATSGGELLAAPGFAGVASNSPPEVASIKRESFSRLRYAALGSVKSVEVSSRNRRSNCCR